MAETPRCPTCGERALVEQVIDGATDEPAWLSPYCGASNDTQPMRVCKDGRPAYDAAVKMLEARTRLSRSDADG